MKRIMCLLMAIIMLVSTPLEMIASEVSNASVSTDVVEDLMKESNEGYVTRIQWLQTLTSAYGMSVEERNYPDNYYSDIDDSYAFYYDVMLATEFGLVDVPAGEEFCPDAPATREFVAHSLNTCVGYYFEELTFTYPEYTSVTYPEDIQVAIDKGWILPSESGEFLPNQPITLEELDVLRQIAQQDALSKTIDESHNNSYELQSDVVVIPENVTVDLIDMNTYALSEVVDTVTVGCKVAFLDWDMPVVKKVVTIAVEDGKMLLTTEEVAMEEAFVSLDYEGTTKGRLSDLVVEDENIKLVYVVGGTAENNYNDGQMYDSAEGLAEDEITAVKATQFFDKSKYSDTLKVKFGENECYSAKITYTITELDVIKDFSLIPEKMASVKLTANVSIEAEGELDALKGVGGEDEFPIIKGATPWASIGLSITFSAGGDLTICNEYHVEMGIYVSESEGLKLLKDFQKKKFTIIAKIEADIGLKVSGAIHVFEIIKGEIYGQTGVIITTKVKVYGDGQKPVNCTDAGGYLYLKIGAKVTIKILVVEEEKKVEHYFYNDKNSPVKFLFHFEDGRQMHKCTRENKTGVRPKNPSSGSGSGGTSSPGGGDTGGGEDTTPDDDLEIVEPEFIFITPSDSQYAYGGESKGVDAYGEEVLIFDYEEITPETIRITKYHGKHSAMSIPKEMDGYTVTEIGANAFSGCTDLNIVTIPKTVTTIGNKAFYGCTNLTTLNIPESVTTIGESAFEGCKKIGMIDLPSNLQTLGARAFADCDSIVSIDIPKSVQPPVDEYGDIGYESGYASPFNGCDYLRNVYFENGTTKLPNYMFAQCTGLEMVVIPEGVIEIGEGTFYKCAKLNGAILPEGLEIIGHNAFMNCTSLEAINIPKSLKDLERPPFYGCTNLSTIIFEKGITRIPNNLFQGVIGLKEITIPETVTAIGTSAFSRCTELEKVFLPKGLTRIESSAFNTCSKLSDVELPTTLEYLGGSAFESCESLISITIPKSLTQTGTPYNHQGPFAGCSNLQIVAFEDGTEIIADYLFAICDGLKQIRIPDTVTTIGKGAFYQSALTSIEIPENVTKIETDTFARCEQLREVTIPNVQSIGTRAFDFCTSLTEIDFPSSLASIGGEAFEGCTGLTEIDLTNVKELDYRAFADCTALTKLEIPKSLTVVENDGSCERFGGPFEGCTSITSATIEDGTLSIPKYLLSGCSGITEFSIPDSVQTIEAGALKGTAIEEVILTDNVETIGRYAFKNCTSLKKIEIPRSVTSIGYGVFDGSLEVTIYGFTNSCAINYAIENNIPYEATEIPITGMRMNKESAEVIARDTLQLEVICTPEDYTDLITWTSSDTKIASVDEKGFVRTTGKVGTVTITATAQSGVSASCDVTVINEGYTITYHLNYAINHSDNPVKYKAGDSDIVLRAPSKQGYQFAGWYLDSSFNEEVTVIDTSLEKDIDVYAKWTPNVYIIVYDGNGATGGSMSTVEAEYDEHIAILDCLYVRDGYTFTGWNTNANGSGITYYAKELEENLSSIQGDTVTLYAQWEKSEEVVSDVRIEEITLSATEIAVDESTKDAQITVTIKASGIENRNDYFVVRYSNSRIGFTTNVFYKTDGVYEGIINVGYSMISDEYYTLDNVYFNNTEIPYAGVSAFKVVEKIISEPDSEPENKNVAKVTFDVNGGKSLGTSGTRTLEKGQKVGTLPTPKRTGYTFVEWNTKKDGKGSKVTSSTKVSSDIVYYAKWKVNKYNLKFNANGGIGKMSMKEDVSYTTYVTLTNKFTRKGYKFLGWAKSAKGDVVYTDGQKIKGISSKNGDTVTLYAKWTKQEYKITYNLNSGKLPSNAVKKYTVTTSTFSLPKPTRTGYTFAGWYTDKECKKTKVTQITKGTTGSKTYYAKWTENKYNIKFNADGGTGTMSEKNVKYTSKVKLTNTFKRTGYTFEGWATSKDGSVKYKNGQEVSKLTSLNGKTITLFAKWTMNKYNIKFDANGGKGTMDTQKNVKYTTKVNLTNKFTRKGYSFAGWATSKDGSVKYKNKQEVSKLTSANGKTVTLYAKWSKNKYAITYNLNKGKNHSDNPEYYTVTTKTITLKNPTRNGYTFKGWYKEPNFKTRVKKIEKGSTGKLTLYAKWAKKK